MAKTDVAKVSDEPQLPAHMGDMEADAKQHHQDFGRDMLIIPRLGILQDLSPQVKERRAEYVEGAKVGDIFNNINNAIDKSVIFVPAKFNVRYIAWGINRGGLVDQNLTKEDLDNFEENGIGQWRGSMKNGQGKMVEVDVIETPEWVGMAKGAGWGPMPVAISFPVTKAKSARKINTAIDLTVVQGKNGDFTPPAFYHQFTLRTAIEQSGDNEWFGWSTQHNGFCEDAGLVAKAKELKVAFDKGEVDVAEEAARG
jgi:hypothetical protein